MHVHLNYAHCTAGKKLFLMISFTLSDSHSDHYQDPDEEENPAALQKISSAELT